MTALFGSGIRRSRRARLIAATTVLGLHVVLSSCAVGSGDDAAAADSPPPAAEPQETVAGTEGSVLAAAETEDLPSEEGGDIADDSAIWVDSENPERSVIVADSKARRDGGVAVFDLEGNLLQFRPEGRIGNVDMRAGFRLGGRDVVLVGANNRSEDTLAFWVLDPDSRTLEPAAPDDLETHSDNYGFCMYRSRESGTTYAFVSQEETGKIQQFELGDRDGQVDARQVRTLDVGSQAEGCVADDETGALYVAEEKAGVWRYEAEPDAGSERESVASVSDGHLVADVEGVALARTGGGRYLIVSSQGDSRLFVYDLDGGNAYVASFSVGSSGEIDAVEETDGVDVTTANAGPGFEGGLLVVHDGQNRGGETSNLKLVPLEEVLSLSAGG